MSLQDRLDAYKAESRGKRPPEIAAAMAAATQALIDSGQAARALKPGDMAPRFALPDPAGTIVRSDELLAHGPLVLTFYRGVWCPYCNLDLQAIEEVAAEMRAEGASIVALSPETAANSRKSQRQNELSFPILTDQGNEIAAAFGLRFRLSDEIIAIYKGFGNDLARVNAEPSWTLPMPARYVIGPDGRVVSAEVDPDYTRRPEPSGLLPVLRELKRSKAA